MTIILLILFLLLMKESYFVNNEIDALSKDTTDGVRGLFVILIFMSHYVTYIETGIYDTVYLDFREHLNQAVVIPFLFYSGYGMFLQYEKQGLGYLKRVTFEKIPNIWLRFVLAVNCFWILRTVQGYIYEPKKILLTFVAWESIGNSNWYVFGIIGEFFIFSIAYGLFSRKGRQESKLENILSVCVTIYLTVAFVKWLRYMGRPPYCYNTLMMFPFGVLWANLRNQANIHSEWIGLLVSLIIYNVSFQNRFLSLKWYTLWAAAFMVICIFLSSKIKLDGWLIRFCAAHVFSIYMLQRIPMIILDYVGWTKSYPYMSFLISAIVTGLIAVQFDKISGILWGKIRDMSKVRH